MGIRASVLLSLSPACAGANVLAYFMLPLPAWRIHSRLLRTPIRAPCIIFGGIV